MRWRYKLPLRLRSLFQKTRVDEELTEELRFHLQSLIDTNVAKGMSPEESRYAALRELGGLEQIREECRDMRRVNYIENSVQDLRYAFRTLLKSPGFAAVAVLTLALGIGANIAIFSLVSAVLLRPLPYLNPERLMHAEWQWKDGTAPSITSEEYAFWREHSRIFESAAAHGLFAKSFNLLAGPEPEYVKGWEVSREFFGTLGVQPLLGRAFTPEEDRPGGPRVAILSYGLWTRRFAADPAIVGRAITLNNESYTVIGIAPRRFQFLLPFATVTDVGVWVPLGLVPDPADDGHNYGMIARLKPGITAEQAQADMSRVLAEIRRAVPGHVDASERGVLLIPFQKWVTGDIRQPVLILLAAVGLVLLIATVNVANLLIARAATRRTEMAVRLALGASAARVLRQVISESVLLAFIGGAAALTLAPWVLRLLIAISPQDVPLVTQTRIDYRVLGFALLVTAAAGVAAGIAPSLRVRSLNVNESLKAGGRRLSSGSGREHLRRWLVGLEVALSTLLVTAALLLTVSLIDLERVNPGFNPEHLWTFHMSLTPARLKTAADTWNFEQQVLAKLQELPGVQSASVASSQPFEPMWNFTVRVQNGARQANVYIDFRAVTPDYFRTLQTPLLRGRSFRESDSASSPPVVMVNEAFVRECCPGADAVGSIVFLASGLGAEAAVPREIVGVAADTKEDALFRPAPALVYIPLAQLDNRLSQGIYFGSLSSWDVRSAAPLNPVSIQRAVSSVDRGEAVADWLPMTKAVEKSVALNRFASVLMAVFAGTALLLAAIGIYGIVSYSVTERTNELGIRMALGAARSDILRLVTAETFVLTAGGLAAGLAAALALGRFLADMLYGVKPTNPLGFTAVAFILVLAALLASYAPARRAMKVDPMAALRYE